MQKELSEMSLEELWELFPIILMKHDTEWDKWYDDEFRKLKLMLGKAGDITISHIGSTAINGIWAKPIVDILIEVSKKDGMDNVNDILQGKGYICMSKSDTRIDFNKGYTKNGFAQRVFHIHVRMSGDNDEKYFRDYLNENIDIAKEYEKLKLSLWKKYEHDRDAYTDAKTEFVKKYTAEAKNFYNMEKIGEGNTAKVYAYSDDKVYKMFYKGYPEEIIQKEYDNAVLINSLNIPAPKVYKMVKHNDSCGIIYERLYGNNMLNLLMQSKNVENLFLNMVNLQKQILNNHSLKCPDYKDFLLGLLYGKTEDNESVKKQIDELPDGDCICHGDFHPGNVWLNEQSQLQVIDFMNVCHGPKEYDIARTYFLLTKSELPGDLSDEQKLQIIDMKNVIGEQYLSMMQVEKQQLKQYLDVIEECRKYE